MSDPVVQNDRIPLIVSGGSRYAVVDEAGLVDNVVLWDGETPFDVGELILLPLADDSPVGPGDLVDAEGVLLQRAEPPAE